MKLFSRLVGVFLTAFGAHRSVDGLVTYPKDGIDLKLWQFSLSSLPVLLPDCSVVPSVICYFLRRSPMPHMRLVISARPLYSPPKRVYILEST